MLSGNLCVDIYLNFCHLHYDDFDLTLHLAIVMPGVKLSPQ